jgi:hypothetical protein
MSVVAAALLDEPVRRHACSSDSNAAAGRNPGHGCRMYQQRHSQTIIVLLALTQLANNLPCFIGAVLALAFYGYVLSTLDLIRHAAHCN